MAIAEINYANYGQQGDRMGLRHAVAMADPNANAWAASAMRPSGTVMEQSDGAINPASCLCFEPDSGRWVSAYGGPKISPYAQAIADRYDVVIPDWLTVPFHLTGSTAERRYVVEPPNQYDRLLIAAHINGFGTSNGDSGQQVYLNVSDDKSKAPWVTPSPIGWAPLTSFGGVDLNAMPLLKLPEAFFLPRHTSLQHDIYNLTNSGATGGSITWIGLQLINIDKRPAPDSVTLPNGAQIPVGAREPIWMPIPLGREVYVAGVFTYLVDAGASYTHYTPPLDCDCEIHDIAGSDIFTTGGTGLDPNNVLIKVMDMGDRKMWRPDKAPSVAVAGDFTQIYPALPFTKPYILRKGHRLQISIQNNNTSTGFDNMFLTIRGVRLCAY